VTGRKIYVPKSYNQSGATRKVIQNKSSQKGSKNPKQLQTNILCGHTFRFHSSAGGANIGITNVELLDLICVATAANAAYRVLDAIKLKSIEVWSANNAGATSNTCELEWIPTNDVGQPGKTIIDTSLGLADIAHIHAKVPKDSQASFWVSNSSTAIKLFRLTLPAGSILDINCVLSIKDNDVAVSVTGAVAGATAGTFYYRRLDSTGSGVIVPLGAYSI